MLQEKTQSLLAPIVAAICFAILVIYLFSQDASLPGPF